MKILVIRFSSIGDIVLTTPVFRCLKQQVPNIEIHFLTKSIYTEVLQSNPYIDKTIAYTDSHHLITTHELLVEEYDYIIDLHHNLRTARIKNALKKVQAFSFNKLNIEKWIYTNFKINTLPKLHIVDRYLATLQSIGVKNDNEGLDYFIPSHIKLNSDDIPTSHTHGYICVVIGAALATKQLPLEQLQKLCEQIAYPIILIGGKEDAALGNIIAKEQPVKVYNAAGKFSLHESALLIQQSKLVISPDTGMMHIAAALKKPIISIWGNTIPKFGMYPYYGNNLQVNHLMFEVNVRCRPCSKIGYNQCPKKHFKCMTLQPIPEIALKANQYFKGL